MTITAVSQNKSFEGWHKVYSHSSQVLQCDMRFAIYLPPNASADKPVPVIYWLSGLTCTHENFMQKAGAQAYAAKLGVAIVAPDTSPRGDNVPDDANKAYDFGLGAGFYVNATQAPWAPNYQMYTYIVDELPALIEANFPVTSQRAISGHSMGGHGALVIGLRNSERYSSISAFSPIANPINCAWGQKALGGYLGDDQTTWREYDSSELLRAANNGPPILVDQGTGDDFLVDQLKPEALNAAASASGYPITLRMQLDYDHSYYFISSFISEHLEFHNKHFKSA